MRATGTPDVETKASQFNVRKTVVKGRRKVK
jgi:hypothetical protein